jgi:hypothetical protein
MAPSHLLGPALLKPTLLLLLLHQLAALLLPLPLELCSKNFKFYQIPGMPGAVVIYTFKFPLVCYLIKFYLGLLVINAGSSLAKSPSCFPVSLTPQPWLLVYLFGLLTYESQGCFIKHTVL